MAQVIKLKRSSTSGAEPSTSDLALGEVGINTYDGKMFIKKNDGTATIVEVGASNGNLYTKTSFTATASQTSFTVAYTVGLVDVYMNGVKLIIGTDVTAANGTSVVLAEGAAVGDSVQVIAYTAGQAIRLIRIDGGSATTTYTAVQKVDGGKFEIDLTFVRAYGCSPGTGTISYLQETEEEKKLKKQNK